MSRFFNNQRGTYLSCRLAPPRAGQAGSRSRTLVLPSASVAQAALVVILAVLGVAYLIELNLISQRGFEVRRMEERLAEFRDVNAKLQLKVAELESMNGIETRISQLGMVPIEQVEFLSAGAAVVARR